MRILLSVLLLFPSITLAMPSGFIYPSSYNGSEEQKQAVIKYIESSVRQAICNGTSQCTPEDIRYAEQWELDAFKKLSQQNRSTVDRVAIEFCSSVTSRDCRYSEIEVMHRKYETQSSEKLTW